MVETTTKEEALDCQVMYHDVINEEYFYIAEVDSLTKKRIIFFINNP